MTGATTAFKKGFMAKGQKQAGLRRAMRVMTTQAFFTARSNPLMLLLKVSFINFMALAAELCRRTLQEAGSPGKMGLMTSVALSPGGRRMGRALLPETIDLMTAQAEIRFFLQQIGRLFGTMGIVAGLAVETGNRLMGQRTFGTPTAILSMTI